MVSGRRFFVRWAGDLALGLRLSVTGGRESRLRTVLIAFGVGCGVATLLLASAFPAVRHHRDDRLHLQNGALFDVEPIDRSAHSLLMVDISTDFHSRHVVGRAVRPEGPQAPLPPGLSTFPAPGTMAVSPALAALLHTPGADLLRERLNHPISGTIGQAGLVGPGDYAFYLGSDQLTTQTGATRIDHFGGELPTKPLDPLLVLLTVAGLVILLTPVGVFVAAAVRFGGEARDRRLAALRLAGADRAATARIAAGESLAGALLGLGVGTVFFLIGRRLIERVTVQGLSVYSADVRPQPALAALALAAVPVLAVLVTVLTMRRVAAEPLGVVRGATTRARRLGWRIALPLAGAALLVSQRDRLAEVGSTRSLVVLVGGLLLLLVGATLLLPPLLDLAGRALSRRGGPPAWQLAVGRIHTNPESAGRPVAGITVTVAGAIALQTLLGAMNTSYTTMPAAPRPTEPGVITVSVPTAGDRAAVLADRLRQAPGVRSAVGLTALLASVGGPEHGLPLRVGDCAALRTIALIPDCANGDAFAVGGAGTPVPAAGTPISILQVSGGTAEWPAPTIRATVTAQHDDPLLPGSIGGDGRTVLLATPGALPPGLLRPEFADITLHTVPGAPDELEQIRTAATLLDPRAGVHVPGSPLTDAYFTGIRRALSAGTVAVLTLIGASMLVTLLEQLRDRRRTLAVLAAFGTRRRTLALAVLYQSAVPILFGLALAVATGVALALALLALAHLPVSLAWPQILTLVGTGGAALLAITALSLPALWSSSAATNLRYE
ncbi:ABC transporter permease [Kitasatospora sp. RB6PN24]|uniref:FtsX-like permease family protein n=1 Tax=Kitasatospora humi TaxID=2893891 RepID=UPI001E3C142E|nr:FtsX-like permease family protein [Kitasatospora humi]MCC9310572.1 ABC transporter permease [Kitasatospora humi]